MAEARSLLAIENVVTNGVVKTRQLTRLRFEGGLPAGREVLTIRDQRFFGHFTRHRLHDDRWVITGQGCVIDAHRGEVLLEYDGGVLDIVADRVYLARQRWQQTHYHYHDLTTMRTFDLDEPGVWALPGLRSPDRTMSVSSSAHPEHDLGNSELWLHLVDEPPLCLATGLTCRLSQYSSSFGRLACLWLDNSRLLTQRDNGRLLIVVIDSTNWPLLDIEELTGPDVDRVIRPPRLYRDRDEQIVYNCGRQSWLIDVEGRQARPYEWVPLGYGFRSEWDDHRPDSQQAIFHHDREIGRLRGIGWDTASAEGCLAVLRHSGSEHERLNVWCGGDWHVIRGWFDSLVGWLAPTPVRHGRAGGDNPLRAPRLRKRNPSGG
jgi:hypothetical protein